MTKISIIFNNIKKYINKDAIRAEKLMIKFNTFVEREDYRDYFTEILDICSDIETFEKIFKYLNVNRFLYPLLTDFIENNRANIRIDNDVVNEKLSYMFDYAYIFTSDESSYLLDFYLGVFRVCDRKLFRMDYYKNKIVIKLLESGASISVKYVTYMSNVLHHAIHLENYDIINLLLKNAKSDAKKPISIDMDTLSEALYTKSSYDIVELLLQYLDDINGVDKDGENIGDIVHICCKDDNIIELLKMHGAQL